MSLHAQIMTLPCEQRRAQLDPSYSTGYKEGHRDARHAAAELAIEADAEIERLRAELEAEIDRLLVSRSKEGDRLDWLLHVLPGNVIRTLVGELSHTGDVAEWRRAIDAAIQEQSKP